ncbi:MAG TPA: Wzz/FepE/Etk N-terminal domain-containing protein, partial [Anaerolineae bacterium]
MGVDAELRGYLLTLWRHRWTIIACACLASLVALAISLLLKPKYSATATLRMASSPAGVTDYISLPSITRLSNTLVEIATSDSTLDEVAKRLALAKRPAVKVQVVPETELIRITASDPSAATARDIANTLANLMVDQSSQLYSAGGPTARQILEGQLAQAKSDLDAAVAAYQAALEKSVRALDPNTPALNLPESAELATLGRLISIRQQLYGDILQRYEAARLNEQLRANSVSISEAAALPPRPSSPRLPLNAALGLLAGL